VDQWDKDGNFVWGTYGTSGISIWCDESRVFVVTTTNDVHIYTHEEHEFLEISLLEDIENIWGNEDHVYAYGRNIVQFAHDGTKLISISSKTSINCLRGFQDTLFTTRLDTNNNLVIEKWDDTLQQKSEWIWTEVSFTNDIALALEKNTLYLFGTIDNIGSGNMDTILFGWRIHQTRFIVLIVGFSTLGVAAIGFSIVFTIKRIKKSRNRHITNHLQSIHQKIKNSEYSEALDDLDEIRYVIDKNGDNELLKNWDSMNRKCEINMRFFKKLDYPKQLIAEQRFQEAEMELLRLVKDANKPENAQYVDTRFVSEMTTLLKEAMDNTGTKESR
jgi:hypothetical protein